MGNKVTKKSKYDPTKPYKWEADDEFVISGDEFSILYNTVKYQVETPTELSPLQKVKVFEILNKIFLNGVEQGVIVPQEPVSPPRQEEMAVVQE